MQEEEEGGQPGVQEYHIQSGLLCPTKCSGNEIFNIFSPQIELRNSIVYVYVVLSPRTESKGIIEDNDNNQFILNDF